MASAVDSRLADARLSAVATASRLPTATRGSNNSYTTSWDTTTAAEAFALYLTKQGLDGDNAAARQAAEAIGDARAKRREFSPQGRRTLVIEFVSSSLLSCGTVNTALVPLHMARKLDRYRNTDRMQLEPWIVEMALDRLGSRRPKLEEQERVLRVTRTPEKVRWPDWWEALPGADHDFMPATTRLKPPRNK